MLAVRLEESFYDVFLFFLRVGRLLQHLVEADVVFRDHRHALLRRRVRRLPLLLALAHLVHLGQTSRLLLLVLDWVRTMRVYFLSQAALVGNWEVVGQRQLVSLFAANIAPNKNCSHALSVVRLDVGRELVFSL